jgi:hypothetical protein
VGFTWTTLKVSAVSVSGTIPEPASRKVALMLVVTGTPVARFDGLVEETLGGVERIFAVKEPDQGGDTLR